MIKRLLPFILSILLLVLIPTQAYASSVYEYYNTGDDDYTTVYSANWGAQTFTPATAHKITSVKMKLWRYSGSSGTFTASIRATDGSSHPTGSDLCSGTLDPGTLGTSDPGAWYEITLGSGTSLSASTKYAIVFRITEGDYRVAFRCDYSSPTYSGGCKEGSSDSGSSWSSETTREVMFEDWGYEPGPPTVTSNAATGVGSDWFVMSGTVTASDSAVTQVGVDYGLDTEYGSSATITVYYTSYPQEFVVKATGLTPATTYHARAKAYNGAWGYGSDIVFATHGSDTLYEYLNTGDDTDVDIYAGNWFGQTFTTSSTVPHTISQVRVKLFRVESPGTLTAYIYRTSSSHPTGLPIGEGTISGDTLTTDTGGVWYAVDLDEEVELLAGTKYALVLCAKAGTDSAYVSWRIDTGNGYASGAEESSTDSGISWSTTAANDLMFEIWGNPVLSVTDAKVFSGYLEDNDMLYVFAYKAIVGSDYTSKDSKAYFNLQLLDTGSTVVAQVKLPAWGYKPGSIYVNATQAATLSWGSAYTIRLAGISGTAFASNTADYTLSGSDWIGEDLNRFDDWIRTVAGDLEDYYDVTLLTSFEGEMVLNEDGAEIFMTGIPGLVDARPSILGFTTIGGLPEKKEHEDTFQDTLTGMFGTKFTDAMEDLGEPLNLPGEFMAGSLWFWVFTMGVGLLGAGAAGPIGLILGLPYIFIGMAGGAIPLTYFLIPLVVLGTIVILKYTVWKS